MASFNATSNEASVDNVDGRTQTNRHEQPNVGKYKFIRTIGKGNFAKVKLAKHVITQKEVRFCERPKRK